MEIVIIMHRKSLHSKYKLLVAIILIFICQSTFAESIEQKKDYEIGMGGGFRIIGHKLSKYTNGTHPFYITAEYSKKIFDSNFFINCGISLGGAGQLNSSNNGSEKEILLFFEPQIGLRYDFLSFEINKWYNPYPFVEVGITHTNAKLENNTDYDLSATGDGFGFSAGMGLCFNLSKQVKLNTGLKYFYIPIKFDSAEENIGGPSLYAKIIF